MPIFYKCLKEQPEPEAKRLALVLERYVFGSLDIFAKKTNVNIQNRLVCFDISELSSSLQEVNVMAGIRAISATMKIELNNRFILLANNYSAQYVAKFYKVGRKFLGMNTIITQNIADMLENEQGRKILSNSEFALILKQKALDLPHIANIFNISEEESRYVEGDSPVGQGVLVFGSDKIPFLNRVPKDYLMYKVNNTDNMVQAR